MIQRVMNGHIEEEGIKIPIIKTADLSDTYTKIYDNIMDILPCLEKCESLLFFFLVKKANENSFVSTAKLTILEFTDYVNKTTQGRINYTYNTIHKAVTNLKRKGLLVDTQNRGIVWVNVGYAFRGEERERKRINNNAGIISGGKLSVV